MVKRKASASLLLRQSGNPCMGPGSMALDRWDFGFATTPLNLVEALSLIGSRGPLVRRTNGRGTFQEISGMIALKLGTHSIQAKRLRSCGLFGTTQWRLMDGGLASHRLLSLSSVYVCLPNTSESVKHKIWVCIQARRAWRWGHFHHVGTMRG